MRLVAVTQAFKEGRSSCGMVHLKSSAECLVFFIAGGEQSFQGWDGTWGMGIHSAGALATGDSLGQPVARSAARRCRLQH